MKWVGNVAHMEDRRHAHRFWWGDLRERNNLENLGGDETIILKGIFNK